MRVRTSFVLALASACLFFLPDAASATSVPYFGPVVPPDAQKCAAGWGALMQLVNNGIAFAITILILFIAPFLIAWGGFLLVASGTNPGNRAKARRILSNTVIGIALALAAWLIVNFLLTAFTVYTDNAPGSVAKFTDQMFSSTGSCLLTEDQISNERFSQAAGQTVQFSLSADSQSLTISPDVACEGKGGVWVDEDGNMSKDNEGNIRCNNGDIVATQTSITATNPNITGGSCDASSFSGWKSDANTMSCICKKESTGNAAIGSTVDKTVDGKSVSWGLMQINLTGTPVSCNGVTYNCPAAFSGPYQNSRSRVSITNQTLYQQCVTAMQNPQCNLQQAYKMNQLSGTRPWSGTASGC